MNDRRFGRFAAGAGRRMVALLGVLALLATTAPGAAIGSDDEWEISGGGWGHGVGLSQYGAYGMALDGYTADQILSHYYSGAETIAASDSLGSDHWVLQPDALWIGLKQDVSGIDIRAVDGEAEICQTGDGTDDCAVPDVVIPAGAQWRFEMVPGTAPLQCRLVDTATDTALPAGDCSADVTWIDTTASDSSLPATRIRIDGGREYAHGALHLRPNDPDPAVADAFHAALSIGLEEYLYGIAEMPASWSIEALRAQAMIARSFGVATAIARAPNGTLTTYRQRLCSCHLDASSIDQNYVGWSHESLGEGTTTEWGKRWVAAVDATDGRVVTHPSVEGDIIKTYYSSSTGGATEDKEDVWGGSPVAYLSSVDDHWAVEPEVGNPYASWVRNVTQDAMLAALDEGWDAAVSAEVIAGPPGTVVQFTGILGPVAVATTRSGTWLRQQFGVRSPYVTSVIAPWTVPPFVDIGDSVHASAIAYIWRERITRGCNPPDNDRFCPNGSVTRGQMAAFLNRALDLPATSVDFFEDDDGSIFEDDINRLAAAGITKGCNPPDNDRFCETSQVTRGQMAAFIVRAFGLPDAGAGDLFTDDDGSIFERDIDRLGTAGVTRGCNPPANTHFCPEAAISRAEMATFLSRALG